MREVQLRNYLARSLCHDFGLRGSMNELGENIYFDALAEGLQGRCETGGTVSFNLSGPEFVWRSSEILFQLETQGRGIRYICIDVNHRPADAAQFKAHAFDMLHLKKTHGDNLCGICVFLKFKTGISLPLAKAYSYPYDVFVGVEWRKITQAELDDLTERVHQEVFKAMCAWS